MRISLVPEGAPPRVNPPPGVPLSKGRTGPGSIVEMAPRARLASWRGMRPLTGKSSTSSAVITWPSELLADSSRGASALTVTASFTAPSSRWMSMTGCSLALRVTPCRTNRLNLSGDNLRLGYGGALRVGDGSAEGAAKLLSEQGGRGEPEEPCENIDFHA